MFIPPAVVGRVDRLGLPERFVAVHALSNEEARNWQPAKWRELVARLIDEQGLAVVEVGLRPVASDARAGYVDLCGRTTVVETAEVLRRAQLFIGVDSGPAHLANGVGVPGVVLLGHFRGFTRYVPYDGGYGDGTVATLIHHEGPVAGVAVKEVLERAAARLGRRPDPSRLP